MMLGSSESWAIYCTEAEWIWRRMLHLRVSLQTVAIPVSVRVFALEKHVYGRRCQQIQYSLQQGNFSSYKLQFTLLSELLDRSFQQSQSVQRPDTSSRLTLP